MNIFLHDDRTLRRLKTQKRASRANAEARAALIASASTSASSSTTAVAGTCPDQARKRSDEFWTTMESMQTGGI